MPKPSLQIGDLVYWKSKYNADKEDIGLVIEVFKEKHYTTRQVRIEWFKDDSHTVEYYPDAKKMRQDFLKKYT